MTRDEALALDAADALAPLREQFSLPPGLIYLDGNSLGVLPKAIAARVQQVVQQEWGVDLIQSWNTAGWMELPQRVGDKIARLVGAGAGELVVADSTSVNLFKVLSAALSMAQADTPKRKRIVSERSNFPTDLYIAESLARERGYELLLVEADELPAALDEHCAVLMLTHVNYRRGRARRRLPARPARHRDARHRARATRPCPDDPGRRGAPARVRVGAAPAAEARLGTTYPLGGMAPRRGCAIDRSDVRRRPAPCCPYPEVRLPAR